MSKLIVDKELKIKIEKAITKAESNTDCEIVPMIIESSNHYLIAHLILGLLGASIAFMILFFSPYNFLGPINYLIFQAIGFFLGFILGQLDFVKKLVIPKKEIHYEVHLRACEAFLHHNLHLTKNHNGVLIFISRFERKINIICDRAVNLKIEQKEWDKIISDFKGKKSDHDILITLISTIEKVGDILATHFPTVENSKHENQLKDELILE
jgi:putative membrane protein